jgi:hypothetical protein
MTETREPDAFELDPRSRAVRRLRKRREFKQHLAAYIVINTLIVGIWMVTGPYNGHWFPWFLFPLLGWGVGLTFHGLDAYGREITEAAIQQEMARESHDKAA